MVYFETEEAKHVVLHTIDVDVLEPWILIEFFSIYILPKHQARNRRNLYNTLYSTLSVLLTHSYGHSPIH